LAGTPCYAVYCSPIQIPSLEFEYFPNNPVSKNPQSVPFPWGEITKLSKYRLIGKITFLFILIFGF